MLKHDVIEITSKTIKLASLVAMLWILNNSSSMQFIIPVILIAAAD